MTDTRPILFATDGSPSAAEAQRKAFELARRLDAPLLVFAVVHAALPAVGYSGNGYSNVVAEATSAEHERVDELLASVAETAKAEGVHCSTVAADGFVVDEILSQGGRGRRTADRRGLARLGRRTAALLGQRLDRTRAFSPVPGAGRPQHTARAPERGGCVNASAGTALRRS